jgi:VIT1/CCC1 family predicted Fe2+/Mn2+ transporter
MEFFNNLFTLNNILIAAVVGLIAYFFFGKNLSTAVIAGAIGLVVLALVGNVRLPGSSPA